MKKLFSSLLLLSIALTALAVPAKRIKRTITTPSGEKVVATQAGDEFMHYFLTPQGEKLRESVDGRFSTVTEAEFSQASIRRQAVNKKRQTRGVMRKATWGATSNPVSGTKRGIVILVNFTDRKFKNSREEFDNYFNQVGYSGAGMSGSVHDFFYSSSYGQFDLEFDVVGPVTVSKNMSYYGQNDSQGNDKYVAQLVGEAIRLANDSVDYSNYDWDGDGMVDQVYIIYAGYGEAQGGASNTIWPHEYELSSWAAYGQGSGAYTTDGVTIDTYACSCELRGFSGSTIDGIGTACHEFSHCMGIPDFYDTGGKDNFGMDCWDVLDYGCYNGVNGNGEAPWLYTSYERMYCGWLTPVELKAGATITDMQPLETTPEAYIIYNEKNRNEYYMLENRQAIGFDKYGYGHGMLVLHVDFDSEAWIADAVNNISTHQRMTIIPADNSLKSIGYGEAYVAGDPFPGTSKKTQLTNTSYPAAKLYNKNTDGTYLMNKPITDIKENTASGTISFLFMGGAKLGIPEAVVSNVTADAFTLSWPAVEDATSYEIRLIVDDGEKGGVEESLLLSENFSGFNNGKTSDSTSDIGATISNYTQTSGWEGLKVYQTADNRAKIGSSTAKGYITTPKLKASSGEMTVSVELATYGSDNPSVLLFAGNSDIYSANFDITSTTQTYTTTIPVAEASQLKISGAKDSKNRFYISNLQIYDGAFTAEEIAAVSKAPRKMKSYDIYSTNQTSYTFVNLLPNYAYGFSIRSLNDTNASEWSEAVDVELNTTAINAIQGATTNSASVFDLSGRHASKAGKGIYIINGRKVVK